MRDIAFGPIVLRIVGPVADLPWPRGACDVEVPARADARVVTTELVDALPQVVAPTIDATVWRAEPTPGGMRFALLGPPDGVVAADLVRGESMHLRVVRDFVGSDRSPWFDMLVQLAVSDMAPDFNGLALHAACLEVSGRALLLCGRSGVGKTTLGERLRRAGARLMSHDRTLVFANGAWRAVSTPWGHDGELASAERERALGNVLFLEQAADNSSEKLIGASAAARLASVLLGARSGRAVTERAMSVVARLVDEIPCYVTRLTNDARAARHVMELIG